MLSLQLKSGEYLTIGEDITVQVFKQSGSAFCVSVKAPREVSVLRGEIHERSGERPDGLLEKRPKSMARRRYDAKRHAERLEEKAERERQRQSAAEEREETLRELAEVADHLDEWMAAHGSAGVQEKLKALCGRFAAIEAAQSGSAQENTARHEQTGA